MPMNRFRGESRGLSDHKNRIVREIIMHVKKAGEAICFNVANFSLVLCYDCYTVLTSRSWWVHFPFRLYVRNFEVQKRKRKLSSTHSSAWEKFMYQPFNVKKFRKSWKFEAYFSNVGTGAFSSTNTKILKNSGFSASPFQPKCVWCPWIVFVVKVEV